jgi:hypothetical protein
MMQFPLTAAASGPDAAKKTLKSITRNHPQHHVVMMFTSALRPSHLSPGLANSYRFSHYWMP